MKLTPVVNFTNILAHSVNVLRHSVPPTKIQPTLPVKTTRCYDQLLHLKLYAIHQQDHSKATGAMAAVKMMMKLTLGDPKNTCHSAIGDYYGNL